MIGTDAEYAGVRYIGGGEAESPGYIRTVCEVGFGFIWRKDTLDKWVAAKTKSDRLAEGRRIELVQWRERERLLLRRSPAMNLLFEELTQ